MSRQGTSSRIEELRGIIAAERARIFTHAVQLTDDNGKPIVTTATCGDCGLQWNDALVTSYTPAPSGRCPFEYVHPEVRELRKLLNPNAVEPTISKSAAERIRRAAIRRALRRARPLLQVTEDSYRFGMPDRDTEEAFHALAAIVGDLERALNPRRQTKHKATVYPGHQPEKFGADL